MNALVPTATNQERGAVLIVALILLVVLTIIAVTATRRTTLDLQITNNRTLKTRAFESAESVRTDLVDALDLHVFNAGQWPATDQDGNDTGGALPSSAGFALPAGLSVERPTESLYSADNAPASDMSVTARDLRFRATATTPAANQREPAALTDLWADAYVTRQGVLLKSGSSLEWGSEYEGLGKGVAGAGSQILFDVRAAGAAPDGARALTGSDIRIVIR